MKNNTSTYQKTYVERVIENQKNDYRHIIAY